MSSHKGGGQGLVSGVARNGLAFFIRLLGCRGMTQNSREVLIELLFLSLYMDNHLSLAEDDVLNEALDSLGWDSPKSREKFIFRAFASARDAITSLDKTKEFFDLRTAVIKRDGSEAESLTWLSKILGSDGLTATEKYFLKQLEERLYPAS